MWSIARLDRAPVGIDREWVEHDPEEAVTPGERAELPVGEIPRVVVDGAAAGMLDADASLVPLEALGEERLGGMCEVETTPSSPSRLAERLSQRPLRLELELDEDRADLEADASGREIVASLI